VKLEGAGNHIKSPLSIRSLVFALRSSLKTARRGLRDLPDICSATGPAEGPDTLMTATPARPAPLDSAKIVSDMT
jgi:hypothetical protein